MDLTLLGWNDTFQQSLAALGAAFPDIEALMGRCRFSDCGHTTEPGFAIAAALASNGLDRQRYAHFQRLRTEVGYLDARKRERPAANRGRSPWTRQRRRDNRVTEEG